MIGTDVVSPGRPRAGARRALVLRLGEQPVGFARDLGEPSHVALRVVSTHVDDRLVIASPAVVVDMRDAIR
jgi:hypothetical protein